MEFKVIDFVDQKLIIIINSFILLYQLFVNYFLVLANFMVDVSDQFVNFVKLHQQFGLLVLRFDFWLIPFGLLVLIAFVLVL